MLDHRDWHSYNEALVRRGELNLDSSVLEEWKRELRRRTKGRLENHTTIQSLTSGS